MGHSHLYEPLPHMTRSLLQSPAPWYDPIPTKVEMPRLLRTANQSCLKSIDIKESSRCGSSRRKRLTGESI